ncbi:hypothetical protein [Agromyces sp. NPDC058104]|uniref:hypothetical protein n=1 Tax=Agromyces sp. NPDC058104 TaxID=3346342 RepID=UPI0036DEE62B
MSVHVEVDVVIAGGNARRSLEINLLTTPTLTSVWGQRDLDEVGTYEVISSGGGRLLDAQFDHRYGDDYGVLIAKATTALREAHGQI